MKFDLSSATIKDLTQWEEGCETPPLLINGKPCLLREVVRQSLLAGNPTDTPAAKMQKYNLSLRFMSPTVELNLEEVKCITDAVSFATTPMVCGQVYDYLNDLGNTHA